MGWANILQSMVPSSAAADPRVGVTTPMWNPSAPSTPSQVSPMQPPQVQPGNWMDAANGLLKQYGLSIRPQQNLFLPEPGTSGFFGQHPNLSRAIETGLTAAANIHSGPTIGDNINAVAGGIIGAPLQRQQGILNREMVPLGIAGQLEQLHGMQQKNEIEAAQAEMYRSHANYWDNYSRRRYTGQPWADDKGMLWQTDDVTGKPTAMRDANGNQMKGAPKFMGRSTAMPGVLGKSQAERQAFMKLDPESQDRVREYMQTGQVDPEDPDQVAALAQYNRNISTYNATNAGNRAAASTDAADKAHQKNGKLTDAQNIAVENSKRVFEQESKPALSEKDFRRDYISHHNDVDWQPAWEQAKADALAKAKANHDARVKKIIEDGNLMKPPAKVAAAKPAAPGNGNPYR
jgi:hypothetical protein